MPFENLGLLWNQYLGHRPKAWSPTVFHGAVRMNYRANFCLLDAARMGEAMEEAKSLHGEHHCLYQGDSEVFLNDVAPFLFSIPSHQGFGDWLLSEGRGQHWGVLLFCREDISAVYRHFRKFLMVQAEDGRDLYFRFYDPRALALFLNTADRQQLREFFGPIQWFLIEEGDGHSVYRLDVEGRLVVEPHVSFVMGTS